MLFLLPFNTFQNVSTGILVFLLLTSIFMVKAVKNKRFHFILDRLFRK
jgi:hypothetical protein